MGGDRNPLPTIIYSSRNHQKLPMIKLLIISGRIEVNWFASVHLILDAKFGDSLALHLKLHRQYFAYFSYFSFFCLFSFFWCLSVLFFFIDFPVVGTMFVTRPCRMKQEKCYIWNINLITNQIFWFPIMQSNAIIWPIFLLWLAK